jgi:uncharacterized repeat protein (TIGR03803 family)
MSNPYSAWKRITLSLFPLAAILGFLVTATQAQTLTTLYSFTGSPNDGAGPEGSMVMDSEGNLYGTTGKGGDGKCKPYGGCGTAFMLTPSGTETLLHQFRKGDEYPYPLIIDGEGNLYGATAFRIFELTKKAHYKNYKLLYKFQEGSRFWGLVIDSKSNLYGVGGGGDYGSVFELTPEGAETVLHVFTGPPNDGADPIGPLTLNAQGNLYGATGGGGAYNEGTVFQLTPQGTETVLYSFCSQPNCADGAAPLGSLVLDSQGNLYGTTGSGGSGGDGFGTVFKLAPNGMETVLHNFTGPPGDGNYPEAGLVMDDLGNLYGTTQYGGAYSDGIVFEVTPTGTEAVLHSFSGTDGAAPVGGLTLDAQGDLYGTTNIGGNGGCEYWGGCGTVFKLTP